MKKAIGLALLVLLAVGMLGVAQAADPIVIEVPENDDLNGSVTISVDENAGTGSVYADGDVGNEDPLDGFAYADSSGNCFAEDEGTLNDDDDEDGQPDNQTCQEAVEGNLPE